MRLVPSMLVGLAWLAGCGQPQRHPVVPIPPLPQENVTPQSDAHRQVAAPPRRRPPIRKAAPRVKIGKAPVGYVEAVGHERQAHRVLFGKAIRAEDVPEDPSLNKYAVKFHDVTAAAAAAAAIRRLVALDQQTPPCEA